MSRFARHIGIDYSGARTAEDSLPGLRVYMARIDSPPTEVAPPPSPRKYWTRRGLAHWLAARLEEGPPTLVGVDHGFGFPLAYLERHRLGLGGTGADWTANLEDFARHWPTDAPHTYVDFIRDGLVGDGAARVGDSRWRRLCEQRARAKSIFHFDVQGAVAKSTHAGLPWLAFLRRRLGPRLHVWPFDGWSVPPGRSMIAEVYPALWSAGFPRENRTGDQHDAYALAARLSDADRAGDLEAWLTPRLAADETALAAREGWILGLGAESPGRQITSSRAD